MADKEVRVKIIGDTSDLTKKLSNLKKDLKDIANGVNGNNNTFDKLSKDADNLKDSIKDTDKAVDNLNDSLKQTNKNNNFDNLNKSTSKLSTNMTKLKDKIKDAFSDLNGKLGNGFDVSNITKKITSIKDSMKELGSSVLNKVATKFKDIFASGKDGTTLFGRLKNIIGDITGRIGSLGGKFKSVFSGAKNSISGIISSISNVFTAINTKSKKISNIEQYAKLEKRLKSLKEYQEKWTKEVQDTEKHIERLNERLAKSKNQFEKRGLEAGLKRYNEQLEASKTKLKAVTDEANKTEKKMSDIFNIDTSKVSKAFSSLKEAFGKFKSGDFKGAFNAITSGLTAITGLSAGAIATIAGVTTAVVALTVATKKLYDAGKQRFFEGLDNVKAKLQPIVDIAKRIGTELKQAFENITGTQLDLSSAIEQAVQFESTMAQVGAIAGASGDDLVKLTNTAREWGAKTRYSANEVAEAMTYMGMAGWNATEITQGLEGVLNLATVGCIDLGQASDFVTDGLTALGMSASQSNDFVDMLSATIVSSNTGVAQMQSAFENVAPIAGTLNISMSDLSTTLGLMANNGVKAEKAGTALKNLLTNMASPTEAMTKAIQKYNLEGAQKLITDGKLVEGIKEMKTQLEGLTASEKTSVITTIAGREALSGVSALLNSTTNDINNLKFAVDSSTKSSRAYAISLGLIDEKTGEVKVDINNLTKEQQKAYDQWQNFNSIMEETADTMTLVGGTTTDLGAIIARFGEDASSDKVNNVLDFFDKMENAQGKAIEKMKQYGIELKKNDDGSIDFGETLKNVAVKWDDLGESQKKALAEQLGFKGNIEDLNDLFGNQGEKIEELVDVYEEMEGVSEHLAKSFDATLKGSILSLSSAIQERLLQVFDKIKPAIQGVIDTFKTFFDIWNGMSDKFSNLKGFGDAIKYLEEQSRSWGEAIKNGLSSAISSMDEFINGNSFNAVLQIGTHIIQGICDGILEAKENGSLDSAVEGVIKKICKWIELNAPKVGEAGKAIIDSVKSGIENNKDRINSALDTVMGVLQTWAESSSELRTTCNTFAGKFIDFAIEGIKTKAGELSAQIPVIIGQALVKLATGQFTGQLLEIGVNIVLGIIQGIGQGIGDLISSLIELGNTIINEIKGALGIHSPSTVMAEVGSNIIAGLVEGLINGIGDITEAIGKVVDAIKDGFKDIWDKIFGKDDDGNKELLNIDTNKIKENEKALNSLGETATIVQGQIREAFVGMAGIVRTQFTNVTNIMRNQMVNCSNIVRNQALNMSNIFRNQFVNIANICRNQFVNCANIIRNQMVSCANIVRNQCVNMANIFRNQFVSMANVARNQMVNVSNIIRNQAISWSNVIRNQSANCRSAMTANFSGLASVAQSGMARVLATVQSYMAQIRSAVSQQMTMNFKVNKTITTTNVTKNVEKGMKTTMSSMNSNMMGVGSPNIMSAGGLGTININANSGGISGNLALEVPLYLDGKEIARASAVYTEAELAKLKKRNNRKRGK